MHWFLARSDMNWLCYVNFTTSTRKWIWFARCAAVVGVDFQSQWTVDSGLCSSALAIGVIRGREGAGEPDFQFQMHNCTTLTMNMCTHTKKKIVLSCKSHQCILHWKPVYKICSTLIISVHYTDLSRIYFHSEEYSVWPFEWTVANDETEMHQGWWAMLIWKSGPLWDVAVPIVAETVTQPNFMLNHSLWTFQTFLAPSTMYLSVIYIY